jgi:alpha-1,2-mannosyltransferase
MRFSQSLTDISSSADTRTRYLSRWERRGLAMFFVLWILFGGLVELRSAFLSRRMGDLDCFLRAAWAVRAGTDLYSVTDDNGFHYNYPPFFAIVLTPLADPPAGADRTGMLPFAASVAICYALNLILVALAVHWLATALEQTIPGWTGQPRWSRHWWGLRIGPIMLCTVPLGHTLMRGQANVAVLAFVCAGLAAILRGRSFRGGFWLAGAIAIKIFPAFLLLFPLWRRDGRCLLGCAAGLAVALLLIPAVILGPNRATYCYARLVDVLILPGLGGGTDKTRAEELTNTTATDSQSILAVCHKTIYLDPGRRPAQATTDVRLAATGVGLAMALLTLLAAGWRVSRDPVAIVCLFGCLVLVMLLLCPVCHLHYFSLAVPLVMGLLAARWQDRPTLGPAWVALGIFETIANVLPNLPDMALVKDAGLAMYAAILLWLLGIIALWRRARRSEPSSLAIVPSARAA